MKKSLLQLIAEADDELASDDLAATDDDGSKADKPKAKKSAGDKPKKKFTVTVTDADGNEVEKTAMAYNIGDIKAYWASGARPDETFVKADLHDEEVAPPEGDDQPPADDDSAVPPEAEPDDETPTDDMPTDDLPSDDEDGEPGDAEPDADEDDEDKPKKAPKKEPKGDAMAAIDEARRVYGAHRKAAPKKLSKLESFATAGPMITEWQSGFSEDDIAIGGTVIYKSGKGYKYSKAKSKSFNHVKLANGDTCEMGDVVSTDFSEWNRRFKDKSSVKESFVTEMAKRTSPADFYKMVVAAHGAKGAESVSWADIKAVADKNDVLIPVYIRDQKVARGRWTAKPKDMKAPVHEPTVEKKPFTPMSKPVAPREAARKDVAPAAKAAHAAVKDEKSAEMQYKDFYKKEDFPDVEFAWTTTYHSGTDLLDAIEKHHGVKPEDTKRLTVDKRDNYYIVKKGTMDVLGRVSVTDGGIQPGRGRVAHVEGNIAISKKAKKERDDNLYGFLVKPQHGSQYISVGTQHSHGPWSKFSAEANVRDKYEHFAYDDDFGHGTIQVVKVKKVNGKWERA